MIKQIKNQQSLCEWVALPKLYNYTGKVQVFIEEKVYDIFHHR